MSNDSVQEVQAPTLSSEVFIVPLNNDKYLVYAPLRQAAFVANSSLVNLMSDLKDGHYRPTSRNEAAIEFLRQMQIVDAGLETPPIETFTGPPEPTSITLFLTTVCNLRCTYCYASAGD